MLCYEIIDISERTDVNKTSEPKECDICHYWYFLVKRFERDVCNGCADLLLAKLAKVRL